MSSISVSEARAALPDLLTRVEGGEEVTITRHGVPVAVLVNPAALRTRRAGALLESAAQIHDLIALAGSGSSPERGSLSIDRAEELVREIRANRDGQ